MKGKVKLIRILGLLFVSLILILESYFLALVFTGIVASAVCSVWSFIAPLPSYIGEHYGVLIIQGAIPVGIGLMIYTLAGRKKAIPTKTTSEQSEQKK